MIFKELTESVAAILNNTVAFTKSPALLVRVENQPDTPVLYNRDLNTIGVAAVVTEPDFALVDTDAGKITFSILITENSELNLSSAGTGRSAPLLAAAAFAALWQAQCDGWAGGPLRCTSCQQLGSGDGLRTWQVEIETQCVIDTLIYLISTATNTLASDQNEALAAS